MSIFISAAHAAASAPILDPMEVAIRTYLWVLIYIGLGWAAARLPELAAWGDGDLGKRLQIIQGMFVSIVAGMVGFFGGRWAGLPDMGTFICVVVFAYAGTRALDAIFERMLGRVFKEPVDESHG